MPPVFFYNLYGLYIKPILQEKLCNPNIGFYRDNCLGALHNLNALDFDRRRKDITGIFKKLVLKITIETNLKAVNFLDVTVNLRNESYKPHRKPNDNPFTSTPAQATHHALSSNYQKVSANAFQKFRHLKKCSMKPHHTTTMP